jgi:hypothetical protein
MSHNRQATEMTGRIRQQGRVDQDKNVWFAWFQRRGMCLFFVGTSVCVKYVQDKLIVGIACVHCDVQ